MTLKLPFHCEGSTSEASGSVYTCHDSEEESSSLTHTGICLQYLTQKKCTKNAGCSDYHSELPYLWQILKDEQWENLRQNEAIERAFSRPQNHSYRLTTTESDSLIGYLDFDTMKCYGPQTGSVRRLSVPSVDRWVWYSKDSYEEWVKFGEKNSWGIATEPTSAEIEEVYSHKPRVTIKYKDSLLDLTGRPHVGFVLPRDLPWKQPHGNTRPTFLGHPEVVLEARDKCHVEGGMHQCTAKWKRPIRRRPEFQRRAEEASTMVTKQSFADEEKIPQLFKVSYEQDYTMSVLNQCSPEYNTVAETFHKKMFKTYFTISSIKRVHNPDLWDIYQRKKEKMERDNGKENLNEQRLFHKTRPNALNSICRRNFDSRYSRNVLQLGRAVYFSWNPYYSHTYFEKYRNSAGGHGCMFLARVLVGKSCPPERMHPCFLHTPSKDASLVNVYDSAVDDLKNPLIFAIFYSDQIYPEYIINYY